MQIKIGSKTYTSRKATMGTIRKLIQLSEMIKERDSIMSGEDDDAKAELIETIHPLDELEENIQLIVEYFGNQFTAEEFLAGFMANSMQDFHELIYQMIIEATWGITAPVGGEKK